MDGQFLIFKKPTKSMERGQQWPEPEITIPFTDFPELMKGDIFWLKMPEMHINIPVIVYLREVIGHDDGPTTWRIYCHPRTLNSDEEDYWAYVKDLKKHHGPLVRKEHTVHPV